MFGNKNNSEEEARLKEMEARLRQEEERLRGEAERLQEEEERLRRELEEHDNAPEEEEEEEEEEEDDDDNDDDDDDDDEDEDDDDEDEDDDDEDEEHEHKHHRGPFGMPDMRKLFSKIRHHIPKLDVPQGMIKDMACLDLTGFKTAEELSSLTMIKDVGTILVPENLLSDLMHIFMKDVGAIITVPAGAKVISHIGYLKISGEALANAENDGLVFLMNGQLIITSAAERLPFSKLHVSGLVVAPRVMETMLFSPSVNIKGPLVFYSGVPRIFSGREKFGKGFIEMLPDNCSLILTGRFIFENDIPVETLKQKVREIILFGRIATSTELLPILQALTTEKFGRISNMED